MPYGDDQSFNTMNRAAYGDVPAAMMGGSGGYTPTQPNILSDIGSGLRPIGYYAPARVHTGYYGMYAQHTSLMRDLAVLANMSYVPRGTTGGEYGITAAGDFGERMAAGATGTGLAVGGMVAGGAMSFLAGRAGFGYGAAIGATLGGIPGSILGGAAGWAAGSIGSYLVGSKAAEIAMGGVNARRNIENFMESNSFRFVGPGSGMMDPRLGGMNRAGREETADFIRKMDFADPYMNTKDLTQILQQGSQKGLFTGTSDMKDFEKKFKDVTEAVKTVTKFLHQTLEDGLNTLKDLKSIGVDPSQAAKYVFQADSLGRTAGRTGSEMLGLGLQGAELFRGTGVNMGVAAQSTMMNAATIRAARDAGTISQETVAQAGGEEALAMRQTAGSLAFTQSAMGRGFGAAFYNPSQAGGFNAGAFAANAATGGMSLVGLAYGAAGNLSSPGAVIGFQANQDKFASEMGKMYGGQGLEIGQLMAASATAQFLPGKREDALRLSMMSQGMSPAEADAAIGKVRGRDQIYETMNASATSTYYKQKADEAGQRNSLSRPLVAGWDKAKAFVDPVGQLASHLYNASATGVEHFYTESILGIESYDNSNLHSSTYKAAKGTAAVRGGSVDLTHGLLASVGGDFLDDIRKDKSVTTKVMTRAQAEKSGVLILGTASRGGSGGEVEMVTTVTKAQEEAYRKSYGMGSMTEARADAVLKERGIKRADVIREQLLLDRSTSITSYEDLQTAVTAKVGAKAFAALGHDAQEAMIEKVGAGLGLEDSVLKPRRDKISHLHAVDSGIAIVDMKEAQRQLDKATGQAEDWFSKREHFWSKGQHFDPNTILDISRYKDYESRLTNKNLPAKERAELKKQAAMFHQKAIDEHAITSGVSPLVSAKQVREAEDSGIGIVSAGVLKTIGEGKKSEVSGVGGTTPAAGQSAEETLKTQTEINNSILTIMLGLAKRIHL